MNRFVYAALIAFAFFFCIVFYKNYKKAQTETALYREKIIDFDNYYKLMLFREKATIQNNGMKLLSDMILRDENNNVTSLSDIIGNTPKVIVRYSAFACDICLEEEIKQINNFISEIGIENIIIFASNENIRSLIVRKKNLSFSVKTYRVEDTFIPFEKSNSNLFVFVLDKDFYVKAFFIPEKTLPDISKNYYETIQNKYWQ
jgi:hypothetical protein